MRRVTRGFRGYFLLLFLRLEFLLFLCVSWAGHDAKAVVEWLQVARGMLFQSRTRPRARNDILKDNGHVTVSYFLFCPTSYFIVQRQCPTSDTRCSMVRNAAEADDTSPTMRCCTCYGGQAESGNKLLVEKQFPLRRPTFQIVLLNGRQGIL